MKSESQNAARRYLMEIRGAEKRIRQLEQLKRRLFERATAAVAQSDPSGSRGHGGQNRHGESFALVSAELEEEIDALHRAQAETLSVINAVEDHVSAALLIGYYVSGQSWPEVAAELHYNATYVRGCLHEKALDAVWNAMREKDLTQHDNAL